MSKRHLQFWPRGKPHSLEPLGQSVYRNLEQSAKDHPERVAIHFFGKMLTYRQLLSEVGKVAGYLHDQAGIGVDDRVVLYMQNAPQFVIAYYAILAVNAVVVPANPMCRSEELSHIVNDSGAKVIVFGDELLGEVGAAWANSGKPQLIAAHYGDYAGLQAGSELPCAPSIEKGFAKDLPLARWVDVLSGNHSPPEHQREPEDWCIIPYSSGTTGKPKGCLHTHASVNAVIAAYTLWVEMGQGSKVLASLPFCHVTGMQHSMNLPIYTGSTIYLMTRWNAPEARRLIEDHQIEHWRSITTMMIDFLALPGIEQADLSSLKSVGGGGAQMPKSVAERMFRLIGLDYIEAYGLSETMAATHINPLHAPKQQCLGIPIFNVDSRVVDPQSLEEMPPFKTGEIITSGPQLFEGYWHQPEETAAVFVEINGRRFLRTGDIGYVDEDGYFFFVDRLKRMINVSGFKVWPAEIEAMLHKHPDIHQACVVADPDPRSGEAVRAVIVLKPDRPEPDPSDLREWAKTQMAAYKVPKQFEYRDSLPRSAAGKVLWRQL